MKLFLIFCLLLWCFLDHGVSGVDEVSVMEGDSVTLHTRVQTNQQDSIKWYYNGIRIAQINRDQIKVCTDVQCNEGTERFRDRLKLDNQTGSLTITHTTTEDSGDYTALIISNSSSDSEMIFSVSVHGVSGVDEVSVMEGDSVTLHTRVQTNQQDSIKWYYNGVRIAQINRDQIKVCTDVQCNEGTERFRDRLKLDHQTGSLTITHTTTEDSGEYTVLIISSSSSDSETIFSVSVHGVISAGPDRVSVKEGDSVTLHTGVQTNQQDRIRWYYKDTRIAQINRDQIKVCTDVQCKNGDERFRDRLKLDHQTGSLTITHTTTEDSGDYTVKIINSSSDSEKIFSVTVRGVSAADRDEVKRKSVMEGESVTLDPVIRNQNYVMEWYFNDVLIAEITGDQSQICTDDQCKERFRDRLKLDHQTGALTIMNSRTEDSGEYKLQITNSRISIIKSFSVSVTGPGLSSADVAGIVIGVVGVVGVVGGGVLVLATATMIYRIHRLKQKGNVEKRHNDAQGNGEAMALNQPKIPQVVVANGTSTIGTDIPLMDADYYEKIPQVVVANGTSTTGTETTDGC